MALDISILNKDNTYNKYIPIDVFEHDAILQYAKQNNLNLILKMHDYYGDAKFKVEDLPTLLNEFKIIQSITSDLNLLDILNSIIDLISNGILANKEINVIAD